MDNFDWSNTMEKVLAAVVVLTIVGLIIFDIYFFSGV